LLPSGKPDGLVCHFKLFGFPALRSSCPTGGRCICNGRLLCSSPRSQNPQQVLTIPGGNALAVVPVVRTIPPKEDKVDTSLVKVPMVQASVAQPGSKAPDENLVDDNPNVLNFDAAESEIVCRMSSQL
jgi:hypothetical protein